MSYGWRTRGTRMVELCDECGFNSHRMGDVDACLLTVFDSLRTELALSGADISLRPAPDVWSAQEYADHCLDMTRETIQVIRHATPQGGNPFEDLQRARAGIASLVAGIDANELARVIPLNGAFPVTVEWMLAHLLHDLQHHLLDIRRGHAKLTLAREDGPTVRRSS